MKGLDKFSAILAVVLLITIAYFSMTTKTEIVKEVVIDTYETVINFVSASAFDIIPSSSAKMIEFRIKPHRLDKPEYTSLEACCEPIITIPTASHIFSLYNEHHPDVTPHLILRPHTGSDVSSSDDFRNFGSLDLYKNGSVVGSTDIFPIYKRSRHVLMAISTCHRYIYTFY